MFYFDCDECARMSGDCAKCQEASLEREAMLNVYGPITAKRPWAFLSAIVGTLSKPGKMPCFSTSTPAKLCKVGSILRDKAGSVCSNCYARKGRYIFPTVQKALQDRHSKLRHPLWVDAMIASIDKTGKPHFRIHDSGDLQGPWHLDNWCQVARALPSVRFWLPTKERAMVEHCKRIGLVVPANLVIRHSAPMIEQVPTGMLGKGMLCSAVSVDHKALARRLGSAIAYPCKAPSQQGKCLACRACWDPNVALVVYPDH